VCVCARVRERERERERERSVWPRPHDGKMGSTMNIFNKNYYFVY